MQILFLIVPLVPLPLWATWFCLFWSSVPKMMVRNLCLRWFLNVSCVSCSEEKDVGFACGFTFYFSLIFMMLRSTLHLNKNEIGCVYRVLRPVLRENPVFASRATRYLVTRSRNAAAGGQSSFHGAVPVWRSASTVGWTPLLLLKAPQALW